MAMIGRIIGVVLTVLLIPAPVFAGSAAGGAPQFKAEQLVALSKKLEREIAARRARVAIISRWAGRRTISLTGSSSPTWLSRSTRRSPSTMDAGFQATPCITFTNPTSGPTAVS